ncbi:unnamed protein product [Adineta ricciae]|uniref:Uncharacterized protein n=1 Tax=Adineta ricciae TaxID=249248 RepID=A0A814HTW3_ADIRI|nr:unnamed protein product [Adineta ricciae]
MSAEKEESPQPWDDLIKTYLSRQGYQSRTCKIYSIQQQNSPNGQNTTCVCGRLAQRHSFSGESHQSIAVREGNRQWQPPNEFRDLVDGVKVPINIFGRLESTNCKFVRISIQTKLKDIYDLLVADCKECKPKLVLSVFGGAKYFTMTERLEKEIIRGIVDAASATDTWILTAGISNGVSKLVGEGISHYRLLREYPNRVKCIGMTMWGTVNESTRFELKHSTNNYPKEALNRQIPDTIQEDKETIESNHTHCILFDDGRLNGYLADHERNELVTHASNQTNHTCLFKGYGVTIIVEGGLNTLDVIENDIKNHRPVVLIEGSGRLADVLATLIEQCSSFEDNDQWTLTDDDIRKVIEYFLPNPLAIDMPLAIRRIKQILQKKNRYLLHVFSLNRDNNVAETIFRAIFVQIETTETDTMSDPLTQAQRRRNDEDRLIDLAVEWNYFDGVLPILKSRADEKFHQDHTSPDVYLKREKEIFQRSIEKDRPLFVEYFLAAMFDPLILIGSENTSERHRILSDLYRVCHDQMERNQRRYISTLLGNTTANTVEQLDRRLTKFIGSFIEPIYTGERDTIRQRVCIDMKELLCRFCNDTQTRDHHEYQNRYTKDQSLRDLFFLAVFMDMTEMAKTLLLHLPSRICGALIASTIFKRYAKLSSTVYLKNKFQDQALEFETYAAFCTDKCYEYDERIACELLLRQIPLFGNVTCMQVAISSQSGKLLNTACFDQTLNQVWYGKLSITNYRTSKKLVQLITLVSLGFLAPFLIAYRAHEPEVNDASLSSVGINYYCERDVWTGKAWKKYWLRFKYFHQCPMASYIFFLLVFSYMMLYCLDPPGTFSIPHWTEIYVTITVSTMFCDEVRKLYHEYKTRMTEQWGSTGSALLTLLSTGFYIVPYFLFYFGLIFRYRGYDEGLITTARIIWAFDLELWYLRSLKFTIALKSIGPKLFMLKNMLQDLFAFVYMIFIAIAAYGVVSRALILYKQVPFTVHAIFKEIFYEPYWFIYGEVSDKDLLDNIIQTDSGSAAAEATATHVILAFHMLFINILILNLLIAVFSRSIDKVQDNTEFYWRYQRYTFVREYFERPPLAYPPLIFFTHVILLCRAIRHQLCPKLCRNRVGDENAESTSSILTSIFKMVPLERFHLNEKWNVFENAATHSYARSVLERNKKKRSLIIDDSQSKRKTTTESNTNQQALPDERQSIPTWQEEVTTLKSLLSNTQKNLDENNARMEKYVYDINKSLDWIMQAIARVKMNDPTKPPVTMNLDAPVIQRRLSITAPNAVNPD